MIIILGQPRHRIFLPFPVPPHAASSQLHPSVGSFFTGILPSREGGSRLPGLHMLSRLQQVKREQ